MSAAPRKAQDVILAEDGNPFPTEERARQQAEALKLDAKAYAVMPQDGGFAIVRRESATFQVATAMKVADPETGKVKPDNDRYFIVVFHARQNASEPLNVELSVNQETLIAPREVETIMPGHFLRHASLCKYPDERQLPGQPRKTVGWIQLYPYSIVRETTKAEFVRERREGSRKTRQTFDVDQTASDFAPKANRDPLAVPGAAAVMA